MDQSTLISNYLCLAAMNQYGTNDIIGLINTLKLPKGELTFYTYRIEV
jgi:hypothetical protein